MKERMELSDKEWLCKRYIEKCKSVELDAE